MARPKTRHVCQQCGYASAKWLGRCPECEGWNSFVEEAEPAPILASLTAEERPRPVRIDDVAATQGGEVRWIAVTGQRIVDGDAGRGGIAGTLDDISTRKVAELTLKNLNHELESRVRARTAELEASNRELEAFSYSVSHDLRAPFRHIVGYSELLKKQEASALSEKGRRYVDTIIEAAYTAGTLVDELLRFSQMGRTALKPRQIDVTGLVDEIRHKLAAEHGDRRIQWVIGTLDPVHADPVLIRLVFENLPKVYDNPNDLDARAHMMSAAAMGAVAFQKGLGAIHSLSHPVGAVYGTHHGTTNAVVMPMVLDFNRSAIEDRINAAAAYLGIAGGFDGFRAAVMDLRAKLAIPANLTAMGVEAARLDELTEMALEDPSCGGNPLAMTRENTRALFRACM